MRMVAHTTTLAKTKAPSIGTPIKDTSFMRAHLDRGTTNLADRGLDPQKLLPGPTAEETPTPPMERDSTHTPTQMGVNTTTREMVEALFTRTQTKAMPGARTLLAIDPTIHTETAPANTKKMIAGLSRFKKASGSCLLSLDAAILVKYAQSLEALYSAFMIKLPNWRIKLRYLNINSFKF